MSGNDTDLQNFFRHWYDSALLLRALHTFGVQHSKLSPRLAVDEIYPGLDQFHEYCLHARDTDRMPIERIIGPRASAHDILSHSFGFPVFFYEWCRTSRRVFRVSDSMRQLFDETDTTDLYEDEVPFPFPSFVMQFETPLEAYGRTARTVMVLAPDQLIDERSALRPMSLHVLSLFDNLLGRTLDRGELAKEVRKRRFARVAAISRVFRDPAPATRNHHSWLSTGWAKPDREGEKAPLRDGNFSFQRTFEHYRQKDREGTAIGMQAMRYALQLSIYLASLDRAKLHESLPNREYDVPFVDRKAATSLGQLFEISGDHFIRQDVGEVEASELTRTGSARRAHWRRGHYRRPKGQGADLNAKRSVWVRPTLVNAHRLPRGSVPGASASDVGE